MRQFLLSFLLTIVLCMTNIFAQTPVVNGRIIATVDVPNLTYSARIQIQLGVVSDVLDSGFVEYVYNNSGMDFVDGEVLTFNTSEYTFAVTRNGSQHVNIETTLNEEETGIQVTSTWVDFAILNFEILDVDESAGLCPTVTTFNSGPQWTDGIWDCDNSPLPVELTLFTAETFNNEVILNWSTATEVDNYGFNVERSYDVSWETIKFIEGHGNSNSPKYYEYKDKPTLAGTYKYRLKQIDVDGSYEYSDEVEIEINVNSYELYQNYPNPFNPSTTIKYEIKSATDVTLKIYDVIGNEVMSLVDMHQSAGVYYKDVNAIGLTSGIYIYKLLAGDKVFVKKMTLLK